MAPRVKTPPKEWLTDRISQGLNDREMAELWFQESGELVTLAGINRVVRLHDLRPKQDTFPDVIPWGIKTEHKGHWLHRLLYAEAHRKHGRELEDRWVTALRNLRKRLKADNAVIAYLPDTEDGFYLVKRGPGDGELTTTRGSESRVRA